MTIAPDAGQQRLLTATEFDWLRQFLFERTGIKAKRSGSDYTFTKVA